MMRDCPDGDIRDLLPLYATDSLAAADRARVEAHVGGCADCASELELLRSVAKAYDVPPVDVAAIAARLPRARVKPRVPFHRQPLWRIAASITLVIASVATVEMIKQGRGVDGMVGASAPTVDSSTGQPVESTIAMADGGSAGAVVSDGPRATFGGTLADLSDAQLEALLVSIDALDGNVLADPEIMATPIVSSSPETDSRRN